MKKDIHPEYYQAAVTCHCGNAFRVGSTVPSMELGVCSNCHPYFTGTAKFLDATGRIDRFKERLAKTQNFKNKKKTD